MLTYGAGEHGSDAQREQPQGIGGRDHLQEPVRACGQPTSPPGATGPHRGCARADRAPRGGSFIAHMNLFGLFVALLERPGLIEVAHELIERLEVGPMQKICSAWW